MACVGVKCHKTDELNVLSHKDNVSAAPHDAEYLRNSPRNIRAVILHSDSKGQRFESSRAHQLPEIPTIYFLLADRQPWVLSANTRQSLLARPALLSVGPKPSNCPDYGVCLAYTVSTGCPRRLKATPGRPYDLSASPGLRHVPAPFREKRPSTNPTMSSTTDI